MKKFIKTIGDIWSIDELRNKIILTLGLMAVYRFMAQVTLPGIDVTQLTALADQSKDNSLLGLLNAFTGGAFSKASIMALGIMPYISASIVVQLMGIAIPYLQKLQKEGESGRKKITQITRWLTIGIAVVQAPVYITNMKSILTDSAFLVDPTTFWFSSIILLTAGTVFAMWLGERITDKGIGNGISLLIMIGIIARFPMSFVQEYESRMASSNGGLIMLLLEVVVWLLVILVTILLVTAVRRIKVQYAKRAAAGSSSVQEVEGARQYIPLKLNSAGVMPIIFAQALMFIPTALASSVSDDYQTITRSLTDINGLGYNLLFALLIIIFSYFYTAITIPTNKMADDLKRSGGFIPGFTPGKETGDELDSILSKITFPGSIFLALLAILPSIANLFGMQQGWALFYGGTSLIIMVGVAIDTIQQINSYLLNSHYDSLMKTGVKRSSIA
ncbi:MAG: preprotein translocase subunit SecY [Flavobacteriaceae bacterium]|nr:preprotein translocase subunit SecY [Flavobacteriaceae bacterium]